MIEHVPRQATVKIRRGDGWSVKSNAEALDGKTAIFTPGWIIEDSDSSIYVGEQAWITPADWPIRWLASGDLIFSNQDDGCHDCKDCSE